ncbi:MAG: TonB-dependent receptor [Bacteroidales bacterium]|nr:TonB-dependent receptor [Bacteroidales bacterium]
MLHRTPALVKIFFAAVLMFFSAEAFAQTITGKVTDQDNKALPGVSVYLKGTTTGVITDNQGNYSLNNRTGSKIIVFSCMGLKDHEEKVNGRTVINVTMEEDVNILDETVVIGYQEVQRRDLLGSVASADNRAVTSLPSTNFTSALSGKLAGVNVTTTEGEPDADVQIRVRGVGSITQDASPLYIVDGFPVNSISDIAPQDIKSVDVLKDAFSTAIYGSRGAYGVVLITLKDSARGRVTVEYNGYGGAKVMANAEAYELLTPYQFAATVYEQSKVEGGTFESRFGAFEDINLYKDLPTNNWRERIFGRVGTTMNHHATVSGSSDKVKWSASYGRMDEDAIMIYSNFHRNNLSFRTWYNPVKNLSFNIQVRYSSTDIRGAGSNSVNDKGNNAGTGRLINSLRYAPMAMNYLKEVEDYDIYNEEYGANPLREVQDNENRRYREQWNASASVTWTIIPGMKLKVDGGVDNYSERNDRYYGLSSYYTRQKANVLGYPNTDTKTQYSRTYRNSNTLSYNFNNVIKNKKHKLDMLVGQEFSFRKSNTETVVAEGFPKFYDVDMCLNYRSTASLISSATNGFSENEVMLSFFSRSNYSYDNRYSVSATLRADGSSKFAPGNQWGIFPSAAVSWTISNEPFLKRYRQINQIKLRYSFGTAGNNRIPAGNIRHTYSSAQDIRVYDVSNFIIPKSTMPNPDLRWEKTLSHNLGLDMAFFNQRLSGSVELYHNTSKDLLINYPLSGVGYKTQYRNLGSVLNQGIEGTIRIVAVETRNFGLTLSGNVAYNQNKVLSLGGIDEIQTESRILTGIGWDYLVKENEPLGVIYGYERDGMYTPDEFVFSLNSNGNPVWTPLETTVDASNYLGSAYFRPGSLKLKDQPTVPVYKTDADGNILNDADGKPIIDHYVGDGIINSDDKVALGSALPFLTGGFNLSMQFFGFDLTAAFNYSIGNKLYNGDRLTLSQRHLKYYYRNMLSECSPGTAWTNVDWETGDLITDPDLLVDVNKDATRPLPYLHGVILTDEFVEDASFLRFNTLTLGYTIPRKFTQKIHISNLRIYATANNLYCLTRYSGYDPEVNCRRNNPLTPGIDYSAYPKSMGIVGGVNLSF